MEQLASKIAENATICENGPWMIPELTTALPTGCEAGSALVIGIGGSTLRLTRVEIHPRASGPPASEELLSTQIPTEIRRSGGLFTWCAERLVPALDAACEFTPSRLPLAVSWSFPLIRGQIQSMGKEFSNEFVGKDLIEMFNTALPTSYRVSSATHDGTSSLLAGIHESPRCALALTLGTGVNVNALMGPEDRIVNTELSFLGKPETTPKLELLNESYDICGPAADFQPFETKVGGLWLGPMATRAIGTPLSTTDLWTILEEPDHDAWLIVDRIVSRAAALVAASLYGISIASGRPRKATDVAYTGGVIFEPQFRMRLEKQLFQLSKTFGFALNLMPQRFGSEVGAAIAALMNTH